MVFIWGISGSVGIEFGLQEETVVVQVFHNLSHINL